MSRILRRPLFRGGPVSSYGTGIASGLADNRRVGLDNGGFLPAWAKGGDARGYAIGSDLVNQSITQPMDLTNLRQVMGANQNWLTQDVEKEVGSEGDVITVTKGDLFEEESKIKSDKQKRADEMGVTVQQMEAIDKENLSNQGVKDYEVEKMMAGVIDMNQENNNNNNNNNINNQPERYEINADDVRAQAALFDELLNEGYEKDKRSAQIGDASDYALQFFKSTVGEGKGIKEAAGDVAGRALAGPSRTEKVQEGKKKTKQTATVMAINEAIAQGKSARDIDMLIAKSGLDLDNKKALVDYGQTLTKGFNALAGHVAESKAIGFAGRLKDGLRKSGLIGYPTETVTSVEMKDKFEFDPAEDVGKIFIETDTETAYIFDKNGKKTPVA
jgi:hypothetical protein